jgi:hypothetical protein
VQQEQFNRLDEIRGLGGHVERLAFDTILASQQRYKRFDLRVSPRENVRR